MSRRPFRGGDSIGMIKAKTSNPMESTDGTVAYIVTDKPDNRFRYTLSTANVLAPVNQVGKLFR